MPPVAVNLMALSRIMRRICRSASGSILAWISSLIVTDARVQGDVLVLARSLSSAIYVCL